MIKLLCAQGYLGDSFVEGFSVKEDEEGEERKTSLSSVLIVVKIKDDFTDFKESVDDGDVTTEGRMSPRVILSFFIHDIVLPPPLNLFFFANDALKAFDCFLECHALNEDKD